MSKGASFNFITISLAFITSQQLENTDVTNIGTLTTMIKKSLTKNIGTGRYTIATGRIKKNNNKNVIEAKELKVRLKKEYAEAIMSNNPSLIESTKNLYITSQKRHREEIEQANQDAIEKSIESITHNGNTDMNKFWKIRKNMLSKRQETYDTLDTDNQPITDPERAKEHIVNYFEELYQAREGEEAYKQWTTHIETKVKEITQVKEQEKNSTVTMNELNTAIKALERGKATGPDEIPNEANNTIRRKMLKIFKRIYEKEETPDEWKEGTIIRIYKSKGVKGQCANERGITLSSNLGKLYERIINNKIQTIIEMTEAQGGGRRGAATVDHLKYINTYIQEMKKRKKDVYITFLDVTKAYDKAWLKAIIYTLHKSRIKGKLLRIVNNMNQDLTARIQSKYGITRKIKIRDSIRQGGVLAVVEYANLMDEIAKELGKDKENIITIGDKNMPGCLLWMDDVVLIHHDKHIMQNMIDTTNEIANRYRIQFGQEKSKIMIVGKDKDDDKFKLGQMPLQKTDHYKYLGVTLNNKGTLSDHLKQVKGKCEATTQTILDVATGNLEDEKCRQY